MTVIVGQVSDGATPSNCHCDAPEGKTIRFEEGDEN
jgi:hypothetical protein